MSSSGLTTQLHILVAPAQRQAAKAEAARDKEKYHAGGKKGVEAAVWRQAMAAYLHIRDTDPDLFFKLQNLHPTG